MARGLNRVTLIGNLGRDPEERQTGNGAMVAKFSVATTERWKDGEDWRDRTEWHNCVCFGRQAEVAVQYLTRGSRVYVEGSLRTSSWEKDGVKRYRTDVVVHEFIMLGGRGEPDDSVPARASRTDVDRSARQYRERRDPPPQPVRSVIDDDDDDIPF